MSGEFANAPQDGLPVEWRAAITDAALCADKTPDLETCGAVLRDETGCYFVPLDNCHKDPAAHVSVRKADWDRVVLRAEAFVHSHPQNPYPSPRDMHKQEGTGLPWVILHRSGHFGWGGGDLKRPPLVGRGFRHGTQDCYALVRDWFDAERGITLPVFPRAWDWWHSGENLYEEGFHSAGFVEVARRGDDVTEVMRAPQPGDVLLFRLRSPVINHGAVYLGNGMMLHHPSGRHPYDPSQISARVSLFRWARYCERVLRHAH